MTAPSISLSTSSPRESSKSKSKECLIVFDGGTGREIERRGGPFRQPEWSALALYKDPEIVREVHESYIRAGATAITTNSYAVVPFHLGTERYQKDKTRLLKLAVDLAVQAKGDGDGDDDKAVLILGSIPPLCGSYEPENFDTAIAGPILQDFLKAYQNTNDNRGGVDVLLLETIGSVEEAKFYLETIRAWNKKSKSDSSANDNQHKPLPIWLSFCLKSDYGMDQSPHLISGESIQEALVELTKDVTNTDANDNDNLLPLLNAKEVPIVLVNCCDLKLVNVAMEQISKVLLSSSSSSSSPVVLDTDDEDAAATTVNCFRIGAYPNAFSIPPPEAANHTLRSVDFNIIPELMKKHAQEWISKGATVLGGCCGVSPEHIRAIAELRISKEEEEIK